MGHSLKRSLSCVFMIRRNKKNNMNFQRKKNTSKWQAERRTALMTNLVHTKQQNPKIHTDEKFASLFFCL